jgi:hypothetical protein
LRSKGKENDYLAYHFGVPLALLCGYPFTPLIL